jgi:hypothetical protein
LNRDDFDLKEAFAYNNGDAMMWENTEEAPF